MDAAIRYGDPIRPNIPLTRGRLDSPPREQSESVGIPWGRSLQALSIPGALPGLQRREAMKSWIPIPDGSTDWRRVVVHQLGGFAARLLLFGSVFLLHPGERCAYEGDRMPASLVDTPSAAATQPATVSPPASDAAPADMRR